MKNVKIEQNFSYILDIIVEDVGSDFDQGGVSLG